MASIDLFALASIAFTVFVAPLLIVAEFSVYRDLQIGRLGRACGAILLTGLLLLQCLHGQFLFDPQRPFPSPLYLALLFLVAPAFYLLFQRVLQPPEVRRWNDLLWFAPVLPAIWLPAAIAVPLAFALGTLFAGRLAHLAWRLRAQRKRFRLEAMAFAAHGLVALLMLILGLSSPWVGMHFFVVGYAILIGLGFWTALYTLLRFPDLAVNTVEAVRITYVNSSLKSVDVEATVARLEHLMSVERIYTNESLSLSSLADALGLAPHQLSELINTRFEMGFSRYVRTHRVRAAQRMLIEEPRASVLSVGLSVGFTSQSNFYAAFREITGEVPGRFRRGNKQGPV